MTNFATLAVNSAAAVRMIHADLHTHRDVCPACRPSQECPRAAALAGDRETRVQRSRSNLLLFLPRMSAVTYAGDVRNQHGAWWIADTCADCDHTAYQLARPHGATLPHVTIAEMTSAPMLHTGAAEALAAARAATLDLSVVLAMCDVTVPIIVDINGLGACHVAYPRATWDHELSIAEASREANASYVQSALRLLPVIAVAADKGDVAAVEHFTVALRKIQSVIREARARARD